MVSGVPSLPSRFAIGNHQQFLELLINSFSFCCGVKDDKKKHEGYNFPLLFRISRGEGVH